MSEDTTATTTTATGTFEGSESTFTPSTFEDESVDRADLSPEETLAVDNWLLSQGIDSGGEYVEKLNETMTTPTFESPEKNLEVESEIINPQIIEYFEKEDPELILNSLSVMTETELDEAIELIEIGEVENLKQVFEKTKTPAVIDGVEIETETRTGIETNIDTNTGTDIENSIETMASSAQTVEFSKNAAKRPKMAWESNSKLPDFKKIDSLRRAELNSLLKEHRENIQKQKREKNEETIKVKLTFESQKSAENKEKQKAASVVAYDIPPEALLKDVKIVLVKRPHSEGWTLPKTIVDSSVKNEERETEKNILEKYGIKIDIEKKIGFEKETLIKTDISEITSEKNYYMAESDSTKKLAQDDLKWVTLADTQTKDFHLTIEDLNTIATAAKIIKQKMDLVS